MASAFSERFTLSLEAHHHLVVGSATSVADGTNTYFPDGTDIQLDSCLLLTLSGTMDYVKIPDQVLLSSAIPHHLFHYLQRNADHLGIQSVSEVHMDEEFGLPKLILTSSYPLRRSRLPHVNLLSIDLCYAWRTVTDPTLNHGSHSDITLFDGLHPFSPQLLLPIESILHGAVEKFVSLHLVKRYPLIFGPWRKKLDLETTFFPFVARSILNTIVRSANSSFQQECRSMIDIIIRQHSSDFGIASSSISNYLGKGNDFCLALPLLETQLTDEESLFMSMERLYKVGIRPPAFKSLIGRKLNTSDGCDGHLEFSCWDSADLLPKLAWPQLSWNDSLLSTDSAIIQLEANARARASDNDEELWLEETDGSNGGLFVLSGNPSGESFENIDHKATGDFDDDFEMELESSKLTSVVIYNLGATVPGYLKNPYQPTTSLFHKKSELRNYARGLSKTADGSSLHGLSIHGEDVSASRALEYLEADGEDEFLEFDVEN